MAKESYSQSALAELAPKVAAPSVRDQLTAAFERRAELARCFPIDEAAIMAQDQEIKRLVLMFDLGEKFDPQEEPVLAYLASTPRDVHAVRLLLQPRVQIDLYKPDDAEKPIPDGFVGINGLCMTLPRGRAYDVPKDVAAILRESKVR